MNAPVALRRAPAERPVPIGSDGRRRAGHEHAAAVAHVALDRLGRALRRDHQIECATGRPATAGSRRPTNGMCCSLSSRKKPRYDARVAGGEQQHARRVLLADVEILVLARATGRPACAAIRPCRSS